MDRIEAALVAEACAKSDVVWLRPVEQARAQAAWHVWHRGEICVLQGNGEQPLPQLTGPVEVIVPSKDTRARLVTLIATPRELEPGTAQWTAAAEALAASRLNATDAAGAEGPGTIPRWAEEAQIYALHPDGVLEAVSGDEETPDGRLPPPDSRWTTLTRRPFHAGRRRRRARRLGHSEN